MKRSRQSVALLLREQLVARVGRRSQSTRAAVHNDTNSVQFKWAGVEDAAHWVTMWLQQERA